MDRGAWGATVRGSQRAEQDRQSAQQHYLPGKAFADLLEQHEYIFFWRVIYHDTNHKSSKSLTWTDPFQGCRRGPKIILQECIYAFL